MAFANGDERHWWQPGIYGGKHFWPEHARKNETLVAWIEVFTGYGYQITENWSADPDFEKVAIYVDFNSEPSHVAKSDGIAWKSKLGKKQDIEHASADSLEGDEYGIVECVLSRSKVRT
jgi:hypothetical protein